MPLERSRRAYLLQFSWIKWRVDYRADERNDRAGFMTRLCVGMKLWLRQLISLPEGKQSRVYHSLGGLHHHTPSRHLITRTERNVKVTERRGDMVRDERGRKGGRDEVASFWKRKKKKLCGFLRTTTCVEIQSQHRMRIFSVIALLISVLWLEKQNRCE